jgi:O-methyltransferase involved in polyketide biosynthesis
MREGEPSRTAQAVAFARAIEGLQPRESRLFEDPYATRFLDRDGLWMLRLLRGTTSRRVVLYCIEQIGPGLLPYAVARTTFIDEALQAALRRGTSQVVILGAGYDTRALRTPSIETAVVYVRFVGLDFDREDLGERLRSAGLRFDCPSFVIWEGVTQYLPEEAVDATLRTLATLDRGSEVVFTYVDRALIEGTRSFPGGRRLLFAVRRMGEPFRFGLAPTEVAAFLRERGFELLEDLGGDDLSARYFAPLDRPDRATQTERVARARIAET